MKLLNICGDGNILDKNNDARLRMIDYGKLVDEYHIQIFSKQEVQEKISDNVWVYSISDRSRFKWCKAFILCSKIIRTQKIDCLVSPGPYLSGFFALILKLLFGCRFLLSVYASNIYDRFWMKQSFLRLAYRYTFGPLPFIFCDAIQTDGLETLADLRSRFGHKVFLKIVVPKNIELFKSRPKLENFTKCTTFLFVGRLTGQKNLKFLCRLIRSFAADKSIYFRIVGDGKLRSYFLRKTSDLIKSGRVIYSAKLNREEIIEEYVKSDAFILTSLYEGFARVFMEAAAIGLPIITTKVSGVENIIVGNSNGFVVEQNDAKTFLDKMLVLHNSHELSYHMGLKSKALFAERFSYQVTIDQQKIIFDFLQKK